MYTFSLINCCRSFLLSLVLILSASFNLQAQLNESASPVAQWLESYRSSGEFTPILLFSESNDRSNIEQTVKNATILQIDEEATDQLLHAAPATLNFQIPTAAGLLIELELAKVELLVPEFSLNTRGTYPQTNIPFHQSVHYRGIIKNNDQSVATLSVTTEGVTAMFADESGTYELALLEDQPEYILYRTKDLQKENPFSCHTDDIDMTPNEETPVSDRGVGCKVVKIYFECDYKLYVDKGSSTSNVTNYVTSMFNQIAALYANENVAVAISTIYVWTSNDPYASQNSTSGVLTAFRNTVGTNFQGDLAHFLTTRSLGGGIAFVDVVCFKAYAFGVSAITGSFQNVPTYSWTIEVVTHELGHNLGAWHTQSCNWPNGAIDNCVNSEGGCAPGPPPVNGGTIMSYCHLGSNGINFNHGFGTHPGNRIRDKVLTGTCLGLSGTAPTSLSTTNITANAAKCNWAAVTGATNYIVEYKASSSSTWINAGTTTATTINLTNLLASTAYDWKVKTDCSDATTPISFTTTTSGGGGGGTTCNAPENLNSSNITQNSATLTWLSIQGATKYNIQYKTASAIDWITISNITASTYNLMGLVANTTYNWKVQANCSSYSYAVYFVTPGGGGGGGCAIPVNLNTTNITTTSARLSWTAVTGASSYTIQYQTLGSAWTIAGTVSSNIANMTGLAASTTYNWRVKANCSDYSAAATFTTASTGGGGTCTNPTGLQNLSVYQTSAVITWGAVQGATNYTLQIKLAQSATWLTLGSVPSNQATISGLQSGTAYTWRVKANCSFYSLSKALTTPLGITDGEGDTENLSIPTLQYDEVLVTLFPNPASDLINLMYSGSLSPDAVSKVLDAQGRLVLATNLITGQQSIDLGTLPNGMYFLQLMDQGKMLDTKRFVVQRG